MSTLYGDTGISCGLEGADDSDIPPFAVESMGEGVEEGRFTRLSGSMEDEVLLGIDEAHGIIVQVPKGIDHIVSFRYTKSCGDGY